MLTSIFIFITMDVIVFDLESTGTDVVKDRILQLAAQKFNAAFEPIEEMKKILINPLMPIPAEATAVHGITNEMVAGSPTFAQYAKGLHDYFKGNAIFGYNSNNFDVPLLSEEFARCGINWPTDEPLIDSFKIFQLKEPRTLTGAIKFYTGEVFENGHDAGRDVDATVKVLKSQFNFYPELQELNFNDMELFCRDGKKRLDLAGKLYRNDAGVICYAIGKDKDKSVYGNQGFAQWMLDPEKSSFSTDTRNILRAILNGKLK